MGQTSSACKDLIPDISDEVQFQLKKHSKILTALNDLTFEQFEESLNELNELSRKCIDKDGNQMVFAIHRTHCIQLIWKATVKIACVSVNPESRKISQIKWINLKQYLHLFNTMLINIEAMGASEEQQSNRASPSPLYPTSILNDSKFTYEESEDDCCIICMDSRIEVILSCMHSYCTPCIEQWNENGKTCPVCSQELLDTTDSWVPLEIPNADEINEEIVQQLQKLAEKK